MGDTVFTGWLNRNETRKYPLHDMATKQAADGHVLPDGVLADMQLLVPQSVGGYVFVSSLSITPGLVSLTILATDVDPTSEVSASPAIFVPLAAISVARPIDMYRNYAFDSLYPGVNGWVAFGSDIDEISEAYYRFEEPIDGLLSPKAARMYRDYPVQSVGRSNRATTLTGLISLVGSASVEIEKAVRTINGRRREVVTMGLVLGDDPKGVLHTFAGECGGRPDDRTCPKGRPLRTINGVAPDCDGNIDIIVSGVGATMVKIENGIIIDLPIGLDDICTPFDPTRYDPEDLCESSSSSGPEPPASSSISSSASSEAPEPPPPTTYYDDFEDEARTFTELATIEGSWDIKTVAPSEATINPKRLYSSDLDGDNIIIHPDIYRRASIGYWGFATIRPYTPSSHGHLIFGYKGPDDFWYAGFSTRVDTSDTGVLYVGHKTGDLGSTLDDWPQGLGYGYQFDTFGRPNDQVAVSVFPGSLLGIDVRTEVYVISVASSGLSLVRVKWFWNRSGQGMVNPTEPFNTVEFLTGFDLSGQLGMGAIEAETHFDEFGIFDLP